MPDHVHEPLDAREDAAQRGTTTVRRGDPVAPEAPQLPPDNPEWVPGEVYDRIRRAYGGQLIEQPRDLTWFPHLLIRAGAGDTGARPVWPPVPCWLSPDLHLIPAGAPIDLAQSVQQPLAGRSYTVLVHVWNLGRFPAFGATVRAWWAEPGFFTGTADPHYQPHFIGGTFTELGDRDSGEAHRLVRIPQPWKVVSNNEGHECLMAVVETFADPWTGVLAPNADRHVGQRNLTILSGAADAAPLLHVLDDVLEVGDLLSLDVGPAAPARLGGARDRGVSSAADTSRGTGPLHLGPPVARVAELRKGSDDWKAGDDRQPLDPRPVRPDRRPKRPRRSGAGLVGALGNALGAEGTRASDLLAGRAPAGVALRAAASGVGAAALHLGARGGGYTVVLTR